jgi:hypothetical protein
MLVPQYESYPVEPYWVFNLPRVDYAAGRKWDIRRRFAVRYHRIMKRRWRLWRSLDVTLYGYWRPFRLLPKRTRK